MGRREWRRRREQKRLAHELLVEQGSQTTYTDVVGEHSSFLLGTFRLVAVLLQFLGSHFLETESSCHSQIDLM